MRSEQEMFDLILNTAKEDERIRAVIMNGLGTRSSSLMSVLTKPGSTTLMRIPRAAIGRRRASP